MTEAVARLTYRGYLRLDKLLDAQEPLSTAHDEMLFIIQHQTSELWMKLAIHELKAICRQIKADELRPAFKMLSRVSRIFEQLNSAWDVLRTMTPSEYTRFRAVLGQSSGFESYQYRMLLHESMPEDWKDSFDFSSSLFAEERPRRKRLSRRVIRRARKISQQEKAARDRIDQILAKVSAGGLNSLTWVERRVLKKTTQQQRRREDEMSKFR